MAIDTNRISRKLRTSDSSVLPGAEFSLGLTSPEKHIQTVSLHSLWVL